MNESHGEIAAQGRILTALLIGPMTRRQVAIALHHTPAWADRGVRSLLRTHHIIRIATPRFTGGLDWRYALTQRGLRAAQQRISA